MKRVSILLTGIGLFFIDFSIAFSDINYETTEGWGSLSGVSQEEARAMALNQARAEAVRIIAGTQLASQTFGIDTEINSQKRSEVFSVFQVFNRSFSSGRVVEEQIIEEGIVPFTNDPNKPVVYIYHVKMRAGVKLEKGDIDPAFKLELVLNKDSYRHGEEMQMTLKSSIDCYYTVFNIMATDTVVVLYPNSRSKNNFLSANNEITLPPYGTKLRLALPSGKQRTTEMIFVIATKEKIDFAEGELLQQPCKIISSYQSGMQHLARWLANIPLDHRTEASSQYEIKK